MDGPHEQTVDAVLDAIAAHLAVRRETGPEPPSLGIEA